MIQTIAGPWSKERAQDTAKKLGAQYTAYGVQVNDCDGYVDDKATALSWFVEHDSSITPSRIFGMSWEEIQAKQQCR